MRSEDAFAADLCRRNEPLSDARDLLIDLGGMYHVAILRGFDPDALLERAAAACPPDAARVIRGFVARPDKDLKTWPFEAVRREDGRVTLQAKAG